MVKRGLGLFKIWAHLLRLKLFFEDQSNFLYIDALFMIKMTFEYHFGVIFIKIKVLFNLR